MRWNKLVARVLRLLGFRPGYSTGIHDGLTCGYGELDTNGFWQYPLPDPPEETDHANT